MIARTNKGKLPVVAYVWQRKITGKNRSTLRFSKLQAARDYAESHGYTGIKVTFK